jgi:hypothetical protein
MNAIGSRSICGLAASLVLVLTSAAALADGSADDWRVTTTIYTWLPTLGGSVDFPTGGSSSIRIDPNQILNSLNFAAMGMASVEKGRWGLGTDLIYMDLSQTDRHSRQFTLPGIPVPADVSAKLDLGLTSWVWTTAGSYLLVEDPDHPLYLLAGARMLQLKQTLKWDITGDISGLPLPGRTGRGSVSDTIWNGIVGFRGQYRFGPDHRWFVPYYADIGTGQADVTWMGLTGIGYSFDWGDVTAAWRYLDYNMPSKDALSDLWVSGAAVGVTFRF